MDTTLWINGQQNYQVRQNSQQPQQFWSQAGYSKTCPQYSKVNDSQSAQFNPGYGAFCSGQTSNHQTSTTSRQLPTNPGYSPLQNHFVNGNANLQTTCNYAQTRNVPYQWPGSACQITPQQDPTSAENWSNQRPPNITAQTAKFPVQNMQNSVSNPFQLMPMKLNYLQESVKTTLPQNAYKESNITLFKTSTFQWGRTATHSKKMEETRKKEDARKNQTPTPYTASTQMAPPRYILAKKQKPPSEHFRREEHDATFNSSGQRPGSQTHLQLQSGAGKAPAFSNSPVNVAQPPYSSHLSSANNGQLPQTSHLVNPSNLGRNPPPSCAGEKAVAVVQPLSQKNTQVTAKKSCPERIGQQKDTLIDGCVDNVKIHGNTLPNLFQLLPECNNSEKTCNISGSDQKHQSNANVEPTDDGTVTTSLLSKGNGKESEAPQSVTLDASQGKGIQKDEVQELEMENVGLLSVVPVTTWTHEELTALIAMSTKVQIQPDCSEEVVIQLIKHLWNNDLKKLLSLINTDYYKDLMAGIIKFCKDTHNSPILSQVVHKNWHRLKEKFTVLEHDCVHFESPYVSPWLNVNRQLDDIDKEFGFPSSLKKYERKCNTEMESMETKRGISVDIVKEMAFENVPQMAPVLDVEDEVESIIQTKSSLSIVPDEALTADLKDPLDLLEIEMMHPDQARIVFEQLKNESNLIEFKSNEVSTTEETISMDEFCCINRWIEVILGTEHSLECCCKSRLESNKPCVISTDALDPSEEENIIEVSLNPMQSNPSKISKIIDLAEQFEVPQKGHDNTPTHPLTSMDFNEEGEIVNAILSSINGSISTTALEESCNKEELKPACPVETLNIEPKQPKDHDDDHATVCDEHHITEPSDDNMSTPQAVLTIEQKQSNSNIHDLKSISSSLTTGPTRPSPTVEPKDDYSSNLKKRLRLSRKRKSTKGKKMQPFEDPVTSVHQPALKDASNDLIKEKVVADDSTTSAKKTVKLALFGSVAHRNDVSGPHGESQALSQYYSGRPHPPPSVLTLTSCSVRHRICEEWRNSYLPITRKNRKHKTIKDINLNSTTATVAPVEAKRIDIEGLPASLEQTFPIGSVKKRGRRKSIANDLTLATTKKPNKSVTKKWLVKSKSKKHKDPDMRRKENRVLSFGVLRHPLDFKDGPRSRNDKKDSVLETSDSAAKKDNGLKTAVKKSREHGHLPRVSKEKYEKETAGRGIL
ncbi:unnamed protein product [Lota lota]